jgi:hypothetical protein
MSEHKPDDGYRAVAFEVGDSLEKANARIRELEAQLTEANANIESLDTALENSAAEGILWIEKTARAEMRAEAAEARAEAAKTALADRIEHCKNYHSDVANLRAALEMVEWVDVEGSPAKPWGRKSRKPHSRPRPPKVR